MNFSNPLKNGFENFLKYYKINYGGKYGHLLPNIVNAYQIFFQPYSLAEKHLYNIIMVSVQLSQNLLLQIWQSPKRDQNEFIVNFKL
jgi:hypothetical protein